VRNALPNILHVKKAFTKSTVLDVFQRMEVNVFAAELVIKSIFNWITSIMMGLITERPYLLIVVGACIHGPSETIFRTIYSYFALTAIKPRQCTEAALARIIKPVQLLFIN
jgi:hypothetical protein